MSEKECCDYENIKRQIYKAVIEKTNIKEEMEDDDLLREIDGQIRNYCVNNRLSLNTRIALRSDLYNSFRKLDVLQELIEDKSITEIMINSYKDIFIEQKGKMRKWSREFDSKERYNDVIQQIVSQINRVVNESRPIADARLEDGSRVNIVMSPVAMGDNAVTIRKFPEKVYTMDDLIEKGTLDNEVASFFKLLVVSGYNILLSGGTSSGKTTLLNALAGYIPEWERIITIEDSAELQINNIPNIVRMETKNANVEGSSNVTIRDLIKSSLRMRPDRIIVGEVRDSAAIDLLSAYNTGHDGSISTAHSNSAMDMLARLESMVLMGVDMPVLAIRQQIVSAIDIIIQVSKMRDRTRKITEIAEVDKLDDGEIKLNYIYRFKEDDNTTKEKVSGKLMRSKNGLKHIFKVINSGHLEEYEKIFGEVSTD